jgi:hypothetical protein
MTLPECVFSSATQKLDLVDVKNFCKRLKRQLHVKPLRSLNNKIKDRKVFVTYLRR